MVTLLPISILSLPLRQQQPYVSHKSTLYRSTPFQAFTSPKFKGDKSCLLPEKSSGAGYKDDK